jgi:hypothetical protein
MFEEHFPEHIGALVIQLLDVHMGHFSLQELNFFKPTITGVQEDSYISLSLHILSTITGVQEDFLFTVKV